jgi:hypothetical protein
MKTQEQIEKETDALQWEIFPYADRDKYSKAHAIEDANQFASDWQKIRGGDREASLFLAVEILKDAGLTNHAHMALLRWFGSDADQILKNL